MPGGPFLWDNPEGGFIVDCESIDQVAARVGGAYMKKLIAMVVCALVLAGCNTVRGVGQDIEKAGEAIQKSSK